MRPKTCPPAGSLFPPVKHLPVLISDTLLDCQTPCRTIGHPVLMSDTQLDCQKSPCPHVEHLIGLSNTLLDYRTPCWTLRHPLGLSDTLS